jgi:hypothetical protein
MLELTATTPVLDEAQVCALHTALLAEPEFLSGLNDGMDAYESEMQRQGSISNASLWHALAYEFRPRALAKERELDALHGWQADRTPYAAGYVAGWTAMHMTRFRGWQV